jgi:pimeloyl-ACP methyl ester carboxylesterase
MGDIFVEELGKGETVLLVHGSLATGVEEWQAQRSLADEGFRLLIIDRRGYGRSAAAEGEDFLRDADDIVDLMGDGAHLVGHSYGGLGAMFAVARRPEATLSLAMLEPPAFSLAEDPAARALVNNVRDAWHRDVPDDVWVRGFLKAVGSDPDEFPPEFFDAALPLVPVARNARTMWDTALPLAELAEATFPKGVVSGGHSAGFDGVCDELARRINASRAVAVGAGHEVQFAVPAINEILLNLWNGKNG